MLYSVSTANNYPNKSYGKFSSVNGSIVDYLVFEEIAPITLDIRIDFTNFKLIADRWDCIPIDKVYIYLLNNKVVKFLERYCEGTFELVPTKIYSNNCLVDTDHKLLHITNHSKKESLFFDENNLRSIWVDEKFVKNYKKEKLKGWTFYKEDE